jgi:phosphorylcholine metabolism protein LicD
VDDVLTKNKIRFWGIAGTLLGTKRHAGIIPWDDDIDIGVYLKDKKKAIEALKAAHHEIKPFFFGIKVDKCLDIFFFDSEGKYVSKMARALWPKEYISPTEMPLKRFKFGGHTIPLIEDSNVYLERIIGKEWKTDCRIKVPHDIPLLWKALWHLNPFITKKFIFQKSTE